MKDNKNNPFDEEQEQQQEQQKKQQLKNVEQEQTDAKETEAETEKKQNEEIKKGEKNLETWEKRKSRVMPVAGSIALAAGLIAGPVGLVAAAAIGWGTRKLCDSKVKTLTEKHKENLKKLPTEKLKNQAEERTKGQLKSFDKKQKTWEKLKSRVMPVAGSIAVAALLIAGPVGLVAAAAIGWAVKNVVDSKVKNINNNIKQLTDYEKNGYTLPNNNNYNQSQNYSQQNQHLFNQNQQFSNTYQVNNDQVNNDFRVRVDGNREVTIEGKGKAFVNGIPYQDDGSVKAQADALKQNLQNQQQGQGNISPTSSNFNKEGKGSSRLVGG